MEAWIQRRGREQFALGGKGCRWNKVTNLTAEQYQHTLQYFILSERTYQYFWRWWKAIDCWLLSTIIAKGQHWIQSEIFLTHLSRRKIYCREWIRMFCPYNLWDCLIVTICMCIRIFCQDRHSLDAFMFGICQQWKCFLGRIPPYRESLMSG